MNRLCVVTNALQRKLAVVLPSRQTILENHHGGNGVVATEVGHIEALNAQRCIVKTEGVAELSEGVRASNRVARAMGEVALQRVTCVQPHRSPKLRKLSPLGSLEGDRPLLAR